MTNFKHEINAFGQVICTLRLKNNLSQEKLAEKTQLHRTYISDVERGVRNISLKNIFILANALNVQPSEIFKLSEKRL